MSEPCKHERVGASDEIKSFVGTVRALVKAEHERDAALATLANLRMEIRLLTIGPPQQHHAGKITPSQLCDLLERTDQPKGTKP